MQSAMNHGDVHLGNDALGRGACCWSVAGLQLELPGRKQVEYVVVELGHAGQVGSTDAAGLEVHALLVGKLVQQLAIGRPIHPFHRARVKALINITTKFTLLERELKTLVYETFIICHSPLLGPNH